MELRHLRYFVAVAEELHFGRAAKRLNMSQPPLSRQIQELEEELGFPLFIREYHRVELTGAGRIYLAQIKRILDQLDVAMHDAAAVARGRKGRLRIGYGVNLPDGYLPRVIAAFSAERRLDIDILEAPSPRVLQMLREKTVDIAFVIAPFEKTGLVVRELMREPLMIVVAAGHRLATARLSDLAQLAEEDFVVCRRYEEPGFRELVEALCREAGFSPRVSQAVEHKQTTIDLVAEGLGVSIIPWSATTPSDRVRYLQFPDPKPYLISAVAWREDAQAETITSLVEIAEREAQREGKTRRQGDKESGRHGEEEMKRNSPCLLVSLSS
jgi:DNA-binding transcriptional LysR family regulator